MVDLNIIKAIGEYPIPNMLKKMRGFLGFTGHYCKFVKHYGQEKTPLTKLLNKEPFSWTK